MRSVINELKDLGKKNDWVCMNRLHSSVEERPLVVWGVPGSSPAVGGIFLKLETKNIQVPGQIGHVVKNEKTVNEK